MWLFWWYILVTWEDVTVTGDQNSAETNTEFKNCAPFKVRVTHINDEHIDTAEMLDIIISMYRLIEYSDNYSDISGRLRQFKRDESLVTNARNLDNVSKDNSLSSKYKLSILGNLVVDCNNRILKDS